MPRNVVVPSRMSLSFIVTEGAFINVTCKWSTALLVWASGQDYAASVKVL